MVNEEIAHTPGSSVHKFSPGGRIVVVTLLALFIYGLWAWSYEISNGLAVTAMRDVQIWGAYIALFMFLVGASAGGMIVASIGTIFHIDKLAHLSRYAIMVSLATITVAGISILPDLGEPQRFWHMFVYANWTSPMIWDVIVVLGYGFFNLVYLWIHTREDLASRYRWLAFTKTTSSQTNPSRNAKLILGFAYFALPLAFALHSITAFIIGTQPSHPYWYSTAMAPLFISSALTSGVALVLLVLLGLERFGRISIGLEARRWLAGFLAVAILLNFFIIIVEVITIAEGRVTGDWAALAQLTLGSYAWIFWAEMGTGIVALAMVLTPRGRASRVSVAGASALILVNVALERVQLIVGGVRYPNLGYQPGISLGTPQGLTMGGAITAGGAAGVKPFLPTMSSFVPVAHYAPTWLEWSIVIGLCALWGLLVAAGIRYLPLSVIRIARDPAGPESMAPNMERSRSAGVVAGLAMSDLSIDVPLSSPMAGANREDGVDLLQETSLVPSGKLDRTPSTMERHSP